MDVEYPGITPKSQGRYHYFDVVTAKAPRERASWILIKRANLNETMSKRVRRFKLPWRTGQWPPTLPSTCFPHCCVAPDEKSPPAGALCGHTRSPGGTGAAQGDSLSHRRSSQRFPDRRHVEDGPGERFPSPWGSPPGRDRSQAKAGAIRSLFARPGRIRARRLEGH